MGAMSLTLATLVFLVVLALMFDFMNGLHDAANSIATVVSTGVLRPQAAVAFAALFNFVALFIFHLKVAATVGKGIVDPAIIDQYIVFGALVGAIFWNGVTWFFGLPSSSSHALIGGLIGAGVAKAGTPCLVADGITKTVVFIFLSPVMGFVLGGLLLVAVSWIFRRMSPYRIDRWFRRMQLVSASLYSLGHGGNDAQKTIGIIWMLLISANVEGARESAPVWVIVACYVAIALGTLIGGWRIVKTLGQRITKLKPVHGFCAETGGAITLFVASAFGIPVSTTHTITGAIVGVGATRKFSAVRWGVAGNIVWAWIFTIPASAFVSAVAWWVAARWL
jgi:PiT family inorganic phosphate transporter